ncbi:ABC transporter permease subunit [Pseudothermotoga thermarum]|uniref:Putative ABC-2 type transport system permease protein n=1 Tax=Pseudothermotoga thermarum DSM 5069 TaxID=688269 RepID=F7YWK2_9THEM|nr:ABC transporter permease subunit [Pseudothermotoga thermarum]AEH51983.1 putative ABC-2 type transport system permease protein [Pseudothermotoga thermarum DSM 5069]
MIKKEFYDMKFRSLFIFFLVVALFFLIAPFQKLAVSMLEQYTNEQVLPEFVRKLLPKEFVEKLNDWSFFIYSQWFGKNLGQIVPIIAVIMAFPLFSREYENGTIEFLLARSSREKVFFLKTFLALLILIVETIIFSILPAAYSFFAEKSFAYNYIPAFTVHVVVGSTFWFSIALLLSAVSSDQVKPLLGSFAILAGTTVLGLLRPLRYLNVYSYILGSKIFQTGKADIKYTVVLSAISIATILVSYWVFKKKEI